MRYHRGMASQDDASLARMGRALRGLAIGLRCAFAAHAAPWHDFARFRATVRAARMTMVALPELREHMQKFAKVPDQSLRMRMNLTKRQLCGMRGQHNPGLSTLFNAHCAYMEEYTNIYLGKARDLAEEQKELRKGLYEKSVHGLRQESAIRSHAWTLRHFREALEPLEQAAKSAGPTGSTALYKALHKDLKKLELAL